MIRPSPSGSYAGRPDWYSSSRPPSFGSRSPYEASRRATLRDRLERLVSEAGVPLHRHPGLGHGPDGHQRRSHGGDPSFPLRAPDRRPHRGARRGRDRGRLRARGRPRRAPTSALLRALLPRECRVASRSARRSSNALLNVDRWLDQIWSQPSLTEVVKAVVVLVVSGGLFLPGVRGAVATVRAAGGPLRGSRRVVRVGRLSASLRSQRAGPSPEPASPLDLPGRREPLQ